MRHRSWWTAMLTLGVLAGCGEQSRTPTTPLFLDPALTVTTTSSLDQTVTALIQDLFPTGLETSTGTRWETIKDKYAAGLTDPSQMSVAQNLLYELSRWAKSKSSSVTPPAGETADAAIARLVTYMALYVYNGPATPVPAYNTGADAVVGFVTPTEEATITTPALRAGINIDPGSVAENSIVTITQNPQSYPTVCDGPLTTRRCQYPLFYDIHIYPHVKFLKPAHVAVCHVTPESRRRPLDPPGGNNVHDRLRLAHTLPSSASDYTEGATQHSGNGENIEILPLSLQQGSSGVNCAAYPVTASAPMEGVLGKFVATLGRMLSPAPLYAVDQGPEHDASFTSPFNTVDPAGQPDLAVEGLSADGTEASGDAEGYRGESITLNYAITNRSPADTIHNATDGGRATATSLATTYGIHISDDAIVTTADRQLGSSTTVPSLSPSLPGDAAGVRVVGQQVALPSDLVTGQYYIGVVVSPAETGLSETSTANNTAAVPLLVRAPVVTTVTVEPASDTASVGETVQYTATVRDERNNIMRDEPVTWAVAPVTNAGIDKAGLVTAVLPGTATVTAVSGDKSGTASLLIDEHIDHASFCSTVALSTFGSATTTGPPDCELRLTPATTSQSGVAWSKWKTKVSDGFTTQFRFTLSQPGGINDGAQTGADGIAFVIQGQAHDAVGATGGGLAYSGLTKSVAIEIDTWNNGSWESTNELAVHTCGVSANDAGSGCRVNSVAIPGDFIDGVEHTIRIAYLPGTLQVFLDGATTATLEVSLDLGALSGGSITDTDGRAWVGFTGATGAAYAVQSILSWSFSSRTP